MQFNQNVWGYFKEAQRGKNLIEYFSNYKINIENKSGFDTFRNILRSINNEEVGWDDESFNQGFDRILTNSDWLIKSLRETTKINPDISSFEEFEYMFGEIIRWTDNTDKKKPLPIFDVNEIPYLSEELYYLYPDYCFPYYFVGLYHRIEAIFAEFGIFAPAVPKKNDREGRMLHYVELCKSLYDFRLQHGMDKHELPAFLYGFAVDNVKKYEITDILPEPKKAYFIGGGKDYNGDFDYLDNADDADIKRWNGNPETQPGDIIVMYCLSPRSCIHSIWRAATPGFFDPFFHYYKSVYITKPVIVPAITIHEMQKDEKLSQLPLVKANMQGINGRVIEKSYYDRILALLKEKGAETEKLPCLTDEPIHDAILKNEEDVEHSLLEPLLKRLGYKETDWKRKVSIRAGRGSNIYPDYVIFPNETPNNESGYWIWEAKLTITSRKQLQIDFGQAKSYARGLVCKGMGLISKEGVWLSVDPFDFEKVRFWSWKQISESDSFNEIFDIAGNKKKF